MCCRKPAQLSWNFESEALSLRNARQHQRRLLRGGSVWRQRCGVRKAALESANSASHAKADRNVVLVLATAAVAALDSNARSWSGEREMGVRKGEGEEKESARKKEEEKGSSYSSSSTSSYSTAASSFSSTSPSFSFLSFSTASSICAERAVQRCCFLLFGFLAVGVSNFRCTSQNAQHKACNFVKVRKRRARIHGVRERRTPVLSSISRRN